jgi:hypothetical protein
VWHLAREGLKSGEFERETALSGIGERTPFKCPTRLGYAPTCDKIQRGIELQAFRFVKREWQSTLKYPPVDMRCGTPAWHLPFPAAGGPTRHAEARRGLQFVPGDTDPAAGKPQHGGG